MFNLIMGSASDWQSGTDTMPLGRLFEYTEDNLAAQLRVNGSPALDQLAKFPCLFMQEGTNDEIAYVGSITRARLSGREITFDYTLDQGVPPVQNTTLYENRRALDMHAEWEFSRHHWAVKEVDLYQFLYRNLRPRRQRPVVFQIPEHEAIDEQQVSVMMPFDAAFREVYLSIQNAATNLGLNCQRADDIWDHHEVMRDVVALIDRSRIVICDCTNRNPNVFYEAGIAHTLGREVILICQSMQDIPFDLRHLRVLPYLNNAQGRAELSNALQARMNRLLEQ